jgi:hypothetical protein
MNNAQKSRECVARGKMSIRSGGGEFRKQLLTKAKTVNVHEKFEKH